MNSLFLAICCLLFSSLHASDTLRTATPPSADTMPAQKEQSRKVTLSGMMLARYTRSFDDNIDINGKYHSIDDDYATSSFSLRRVRLQAKARINEKAEASVLLNLTEFSGNTSGKVLEIATIKYKFSDYLNLQVGQFRPYFGMEDLYSEELLQSLERTNLYYAFGANGWQSFQVGATVFGKFDLFSLPVSYYVGVFNGNGRNQPMDHDNGKLFPARLELGLRPNTKLGLNGGAGKAKGEKVWAIDADIQHIAKLGGPWELEVQSEYKYGTNSSMFDTATCADKLMKNYLLSGYYILPNLKYNINSTHVKALELSARYENFNCDVKGESPIKKTFIPMISCQLADEYFLRIQLGMILDAYSKLPDPASAHNATRFVCQLQARF